MTGSEILQIITGFAGSLGFGILFNIRRKRLIIASLGGLLAWFLFVALNKAISNEVICYFCVAAVISFYAEISARICKTPTTAFVTTSLIPLIPGSSLYYTMASAFTGNPEIFLQKAISTLQLASSLALGVIVSAAITKMLFKKTSIKTEE